MKTIKGTTIKGWKMLRNYYGAQYTELYQVYGKYSWNKEFAIESCKSRMFLEHGSNFRIISWNTFQFTCGWQLPNGDVRIETAQNSYLITDALPF